MDNLKTERSVAEVLGEKHEVSVDYAMETVYHGDETFWCVKVYKIYIDGYNIEFDFNPRPRFRVYGWPLEKTPDGNAQRNQYILCKVGLQEKVKF